MDSGSSGIDGEIKGICNCTLLDGMGFLFILSTLINIF